MIEWHISFPYFNRLAHDTAPWAVNVRTLVNTIQQWAKDYNCIYYNSDRMKCSEEDFLVIKLTAPDAVSFVYDKVETK